MKRDFVIPNWQKELTSFKGIKSTIIIEGNIYDRYPYLYNENGEIKVKFLQLQHLVKEIYNDGDTKDVYNFLLYDPLLGFQGPEDTLCKYRKNNTSSPVDIIRAAVTDIPEQKSIAVLINFASRLIPDADRLDNDDVKIFLNLQAASNNAKRHPQTSYINTMILVVDKLSSIPAWFYADNPHTRTITIPNPDRSVRAAYIEHSAKEFDFSEDDADTKRKINRFIDLTDGMKLMELEDIRRLYAREKKNISDLSEVVSIFKYGFKDDKWLQMREKVGPDIKDFIRQRVKGQEQAVDMVISTLKRAVVGLSGMQHSSDAKPRGILFLVGPTGTGKTELVKAITERLFEDERALIRFDMSEYQEENSDQKLFGAPPGYVGYSEGGQLTNAVKRNPFSILLFDEIEKAHPSIMDKFLQILEDGRMTDGQGNTVFFSETLIFFTSNVGMSSEEESGKKRTTEYFVLQENHGDDVSDFQGVNSEKYSKAGIAYEYEEGGTRSRKYLVTPGEPYENIKRKVEQAIEQYFKPEVLNRIGENIVVFNFIDQECSNEIVKSKLDSIAENINKKLNITIKIEDSAYEWFYEKCWEKKARMYGGRGIGNIIELNLLTPLSAYIVDNGHGEGSEIAVAAQDEQLFFL